MSIAFKNQAAIKLKKKYSCLSLSPPYPLKSCFKKSIPSNVSG